MTQSGSTTGASTRSASTTRSEQTEKLAYIDALRGYAILLVICVHCAQHFPGLGPAAKALTSQGARGVQLFFVVSAMTLMISWYQRNDGTPAFLVRRVFRVVPMFWLALLLFLLIDGLAPRAWAPSGIDWWHIALTALLLHQWHPETINSVVPGGWSVGVELTFYLTLPLLVRVMTTPARAIAIIIPATAVLVLGSRYFGRLLIRMFPEASPDLLESFVTLWFPSQFPAFLFGILAFLLLRGGAARLGPGAANALLVAAIAGCLALPFVVPPLPMHLAYALCFAAITFSLALGGGRFLVTRLARFIGKISYSAYFWHFAVLAAVDALAARGINPLAVNDPASGMAHAVALYVIVTAVTALASTLSYHAVEAPMIDAGRRLARRVAQPTVARPAPVAAAGE